MLGFGMRRRVGIGKRSLCAHGVALVAADAGLVTKWAWRGDGADDRGIGGGLFSSNNSPFGWRPMSIEGV